MNVQRSVYQTEVVVVGFDVFEVLAALESLDGAPLLLGGMPCDDPARRDPLPDTTVDLDVVRSPSGEARLVVRIERRLPAPDVADVT